MRSVAAGRVDHRVCASCDVEAADAQLRAAAQARDAAKAQNVRALTLNGGYFVAGEKPTQSNGTFSVFATVAFHLARWTRQTQPRAGDR